MILQKQLSAAIVFNQAVFNTVFNSLHSFHAGNSTQAKNTDSSSLHAGSILRKLGFAQKIGARGNVSPSTSLQCNIYTRVFNASYTQAASGRMVSSNSLHTNEKGLSLQRSLNTAFSAGFTQVLCSLQVAVFKFQYSKGSPQKLG